MLVREIDLTRVARGSVALWWLGQSGFAIKGGNLTLFLDPYLSTRLERLTANFPDKKHVRLCGIPVPPEAITNADYVFCSHDHGDHLDPETVTPIAAASPGARFVVPRAARCTLLNLGIAAGRVVPVNGDEVLDLDGIKIIGIPGKHNEFDWTEEHGYPYLGFIIQVNGLCIYHAGDTVMYDGLLQRLAPYRVDLAILPINGGDPDRVARGFKSNLNYKEAADLVVAMGAKLIVPAHYGMFGVNDEKVERFVDYMAAVHPGQSYRVPTLGERFLFNPDFESTMKSCGFTAKARAR